MIEDLTDEEREQLISVYHEVAAWFEIAMAPVMKLSDEIMEWARQVCAESSPSNST
jgi:hypothetical protein